MDSTKRSVKACERDVYCSLKHSHDYFVLVPSFGLLQLKGYRNKTHYWRCGALAEELSRHTRIAENEGCCSPTSRSSLRQASADFRQCQPNRSRSGFNAGRAIPFNQSGRNGELTVRIQPEIPDLQRARMSLRMLDRVPVVDDALGFRIVRPARRFGVPDERLLPVFRRRRRLRIPSRGTCCGEPTFATPRRSGCFAACAGLPHDRRYQRHHGWANVELMHADPSRFNVPIDVDGILSTFMLSTVPEHENIIERAAQSLRPGGLSSSSM